MIQVSDQWQATHSVNTNENADVIEFLVLIAF